MGRHLVSRAAVAAVLLVLAAAVPVSAHPLGGDVDAPLPLVAYMAGAAVAVALSFAFAAIADDRPLPSATPGRVRTLWRPLRAVLRATGVLAWLWVMAQAVAGGTSDAEVGALLLWVYGWIGLALVSALLGPAWTWLDPFSSLHDLLAAVVRRLRPRSPGPVAWPRRVQAWPAVAAMLVFVWLELVGRLDDGRQLGVVLVAYTLVALAGMARYGQARWRAHGETFSVWFGLLGRLAPWGLVGARQDGRLQRRSFGSALGTEPWDASLLALVAIGAGAVVWDGVISTDPYRSFVGAPHPLLASVLLLGFLGVLVALVEGAARRVGRAAMGAGLVPVAVGYIVAHYLTYVLVEGQRLVVAISDPFQQGWDLFGTVGFEPRDDLLPTSLVWTLQVTAVVLGHVTGAWFGHAAVRRRRATDPAVVQWPLAALMIGLTVLALWSLGQNLTFVTDTAPATA
jgi:hypothetical protein